jgi:hypothetical protein
VVSCPHHKLPLRDSCPHCDAPVIPHRSLRLQLIDCHSCGSPIISPHPGSKHGSDTIPAALAALQRDLLAILTSCGEARAPLTAQRGSLSMLRALLAVSASSNVRNKLSSYFGMAPLFPTQQRMRFEHIRIDDRIAWLTIIATWIGDWPRSFFAGANAAGLTRRTFARTNPSAALTEAIMDLPSGQTRERTWVPILEDPELLRLRRRNPTEYQVTRARRILEACGSS